MRKLYQILILTFVFQSCSKLTSNKVDLVCNNGDQKITIEIEGGKDFLIYNQPIRTNFITTNIDPINLRIIGPGIFILGTSKNKNGIRTGMRTEIKVPKNYLDNDTLNIKIWYNQKRCDFKIPVKKPVQ